MGTKRWLLVTACTFMLGACASGTAPPGADVAAPSRTPEGSVSKPKAGKSPRPSVEPVENPAPDFSFETFEGETFRLSDYRGTPMVLNFWESW